MFDIWFYAILSVLAVSAISLLGVLTLAMHKENLERWLIYLVSLSAGTLLGDAFIHLIPEAYESGREPLSISFYVLSGIIVFFLLEKFLHWQHCHDAHCDEHTRRFSYLILAGDSLHNFIDGLIIAASYIASIPVGVATTIAVIVHEIPQEIGDFGALIYAGFSRMKALFFNFATAITAVAGAIVVLSFGTNADRLVSFLVPFAAGGFIYIATADLIPEIHKHTDTKKSFFQLVFFVIGIGLMLGLLLFG